MRSYELLVILNARLDDVAKEALIAKITGFLETNQASIKRVDKWGTKKLAYPINYQTEGYYTIFEFESPTDLIAAVEPKLRIEENVIRVLFTVK